MNAPHEEAVEFAKQSKRENRVYVGNLSYDVKYRDLMEFMRGGGWGHFRLAVVGFGFGRRFGSGRGVGFGLSLVLVTPRGKRCQRKMTRIMGTKSCPELRHG